MVDVIEKRDKPLRSKYSNNSDAKELIEALNRVLNRYYKVFSLSLFLSLPPSYPPNRKSKELWEPLNSQANPTTTVIPPKKKVIMIVKKTIIRMKTKMKEGI